MIEILKDFFAGPAGPVASAFLLIFAVTAAVLLICRYGFARHFDNVQRARKRKKK